MRNLVAGLSAVVVSIFMSVNGVSAQEYPVADIRTGPWIADMGENGFNILWTSSCRTLSWVEIAPDDETDFDSCERVKFYQTISGRRVLDTFHNIRVTGLEPGTRYRYRIMSKSVVNDDSAYHTDYGDLLQMPVEGDAVVRTLDRTAELCRFSMLNDIHGNAEKYRSLLNGVSGDDMDFLVLLGDIVSYVNDTDAMLDCAYGTVPGIVASVPVLYARGNHETRGRQAHLFQNYNPTSTGETYFMFRQGPVAFLVLDAGEDKPDDNKEYSGAVDFSSFRRQQQEWLKNVIYDPLFAEAPVKVALMHIPPFDGDDSWYGEKLANELFVPVLNEAGVDLMLCGHYHEYIFIDKSVYGNEFPIVAHDHVSRLDFSSDGDGFQLLIYDMAGNVVRTYEVEK